MSRMNFNAYIREMYEHGCSSNHSLHEECLISLAAP